MTHKLFSNRWLMAVVLLVLPLLLQMFGNAWVRIADMSLLYVLLALGLNIVVGYAGLLDLGYVGFYAIGAYTVALMQQRFFDRAGGLDVDVAAGVGFVNTGTGIVRVAWDTAPAVATAPASSAAISTDASRARPGWRRW